MYVLWRCIIQKHKHKRNIDNFWFIIIHTHPRFCYHNTHKTQVFVYHKYTKPRFRFIIIHTSPDYCYNYTYTPGFENSLHFTEKETAISNILFLLSQEINDDSWSEAPIITSKTGDKRKQSHQHHTYYIQYTIQTIWRRRKRREKISQLVKGNDIIWPIRRSTMHIYICPRGYPTHTSLIYVWHHRSPRIVVLNRRFCNFCLALTYWYFID